MFVLRAKVKLAPAPRHVAGVQAPAEAAAALAAVTGALPRAAWQRADLPSGTWIAAPSADGRLRWWWSASEAQLNEAAPLAAVLGLAPASQWQVADLAAGIPWIAPATQDLHQGLLSGPGSRGAQRRPRQRQAPHGLRHHC
ncbi:hypothetical protein G6F57_020828 [Rhizopus arrhizus]|nr:hypothetical protein G6F57_020828 [Rhizopus arrhizus]